MARFIALRLLHTILILFGVSIVAFGLIHLIPGNPLDILLPPEAPKEVVERLKVPLLRRPAPGLIGEDIDLKHCRGQQGSQAAPPPTCSDSGQPRSAWRVPANRRSSFRN